MIFARLEQVTPKVTSNEPFIFCSKCHAYYFGGRPGAYCSRCGHKFKDMKEPQMITVELEEEMPHEKALEYVRERVNWEEDMSGLTLTIYKCPICGRERRNLPDFEKYDSVEVEDRVCSRCREAVLVVSSNKDAVGRLVSRENFAIDRERWN